MERQVSYHCARRRYRSAMVFQAALFSPFTHYIALCVPEKGPIAENETIAMIKAETRLPARFNRKMHAGLRSRSCATSTTNGRTTNAIFTAQPRHRAPSPLCISGARPSAFSQISILMLLRGRQDPLRHYSSLAHYRSSPRLPCKQGRI
jgi:hypothetical protein